MFTVIFIIYYLLFIETSILSWKHLIDVHQKLTFKRGKIRLRARVIGNRCKRVSIVSVLVRLTKIENVWFCSGGFSYAIQEKFTAWRRSESQVSADFTGKNRYRTNVVRCRFFAWNSTWNSLVRHWNFSIILQRCALSCYHARKT